MSQPDPAAVLAALDAQQQRHADNIRQGEADRDRRKAVAEAFRGIQTAGAAALPDALLDLGAALTQAGLADRLDHIPLELEEDAAAYPIGFAPAATTGQAQAAAVLLARLACQNDARELVGLVHRLRDKGQLPAVTYHLRHWLGDALLAEPEPEPELEPEPEPPGHPATDTGADAPCILWHGGRQYSIGDYGPVVLTETEHMVLEAFLGDGRKLRPVTALDKDELCNRSVDHAPKVLKALCLKYDGRFGQAITLPGGKGRGGYAVRVRPAD
jgi:hypothetical protein